MDYIKKANYHIDVAKRKEKSWLFFSPNYELAADNYKIAANNMALASKLKESSKLFSSAAKCYIKTDNIYEAGTLYEKAYEYSNDLKYIEKAIKCYDDNGNYMKIGRLMILLGDKYCVINDYETAISKYLESINYLRLSNSKTYEMKTLIKIGDIYVSMEKYQKASDIYQKILDEYIELSNKLYMTTRILLKLVLCNILLNDVVNAIELFNKYENKLSNYGNNSRDYKMTQKIIKCNDDVDFNSIMDEYNDIIKRYDGYIISLLVNVKKYMDAIDLC